MRLYYPIAKVDAEQRMVWGYASTEAEDDQHEIVTRAAMSGALDDYMRFANIREMHQPSAVGVAKEASMDGTGLYLGAKIIDEAAWQKVVEGVYKGFSIGGRVTARDPQDRKNITGLTLTEISIVDRPANPEAVFDCWKRSDGGDDMTDGLGKLADTEAGRALAALAVPAQIWDCGNPGHRHTGKTDAVNCIAKRGAGGDSGIAYPGATDAELAEHGKRAIALAGTTAEALIDELNVIAVEKVADPDDTQSGLIRKFRELLPETKRIMKIGWGCGVSEHSHDTEGDAAACFIKQGGVGAILDSDPVLAAGQAALALAAEALAKAKDKPYGNVEYADKGYQEDGKERYPVDTEKHIRAAWSYINKPKNCAKYSGGDCAKVKAAIVSAWKAKIDKDGPPSAEKAIATASLAKSLWDIGDLAMVVGYMRDLQERLEYEAAVEGDDSSLPAKAAALCAQLVQLLRDLVTEETAEVEAGTEIDEGALMEAIGGRAGDFTKAVSALEIQGGASAVVDWLAKATIPPENVIAEFIEQELRKAGARNSATDKQRIQKMHDLTGELGAECADMEAAAATGDLAKMQEQNADLTKMVGDMSVVVGKLSGALGHIGKRVEDIAQTPLPAQTMRTESIISVSKGQDGGGSTVAVDVVAALANMSNEERTLALIKAARAQPIRTLVSAG